MAPCETPRWLSEIRAYWLRVTREEREAQSLPAESLHGSRRASPPPPPQEAGGQAETPSVRRRRRRPPSPQ